MQPHYLQPDIAPPTVQSRRRALLANLSTATAEVASAEREIDSLVRRLAERNIAPVGYAPINEHTLRNAVSRLGFAQVQQARLREAVLGAESHDFMQHDEIGGGLREAFDRIVAPAQFDANDEHRLTACDLGVGRYA